MGGLLIWITVVFIIFLFYILSSLFPNTWLAQFNFLSRGQTWLPLFTLIVASLVGLADDILVVKGWGKYVGGGISFKKRLLIVILIGLIGSLWFYQKLGWDTVYIPFVAESAHAYAKKTWAGGMPRPARWARLQAVHEAHSGCEQRQAFRE